MKPIGIYVHVPFCESKCPYCDFYSFSANKEMFELYIEAVCKSIRYWLTKINRTVDTLYFGGGTPSLIGADRISKVIYVTKEFFNVNNCEITIEVNPTKANNLDFKKLKEAGVNRLSIGLQSANDNELKFLGRRHSVTDAENTICLAKNNGFDNISLDLMLGIMEQTTSSLQRSIEFCVKQEIQHISAYLLKIEKGTKYYKQREKMIFPNEEITRLLYLYICDVLKKYGFNQYEISNFSLPNKQSKHNLKYWNCDEYIGIGPSAHSFIDTKRFYYNSNINDFINGKQPILDAIGGSIEEYIMLKLRLNKGLNNKDFNNKFGYDIPEKYYEKAKLYEKYGFTSVKQNSISLTPEGFLVSNKLITDILY